MTTKQDIANLIKNLEKKLKKKDIYFTDKFIKKTPLEFFKDLIKKLWKLNL
ncbi:MAG: hypothetical protein ACO3UU_13305 [Minisyncoccia bacterium]